MLSKYILYAINQLNSNSIKTGKTFIQKLIYFSLPPDQRHKYYIPYFYGPYSENVQQLLNSLIDGNYLTYENKVLNSKYDIKLDKPNVLSSRFDKTITFLLSKNINSTKDISLLAKTFMILDDNNLIDKKAKANQSQLNILRNSASLIGWMELINLEDSELRKYITLSKELESNILN
ncbi:MAG: hypothetical protein H6609_19245 [Ignavibacteriales bacterium]|nr:hypothetical protein [Ignavibacteriales bacterium]